MKRFGNSTLINKSAIAALTMASVAGLAIPSAHAAEWGDLDNLIRKPVVKQAAIGAAAGAAGGLLSDRVAAGRGILAGGIAGAGSGLLSQSRYFDDKPLVRNALQGGIIG